jgi:hypothetical protein
MNELEVLRDVESDQERENNRDGIGYYRGQGQMNGVTSSTGHNSK